MAEDLHIGLGKHLRQFIISWDGQEAAEAVNEVALAQAAIEYLSTRSAVSAERPVGLRNESS